MSSPSVRLLAQVSAVIGAGDAHIWCRWVRLLAQVRFLGGGLRRKTVSYALQWRRSYPFFHTCASKGWDLRQYPKRPAPATLETCTSNVGDLHQRRWRPAPARALGSVACVRVCPGRAPGARRGAGEPLAGCLGWNFAGVWLFWQKVCIFAGRERRRPGFGRRLLFNRAEASVWRRGEASAERH